MTIKELIAQRDYIADGTAKTREMADKFPRGSPEREAIYKQLLDDIVKGLEERARQRLIWDFSKEKSQRIFAIDDDLTLRPLNTSDVDFYWDIKKQYSAYYRLILKTEIHRRESMFIADMCVPESFYCIIASQENPIGYLGIKDTEKDIWELAIELDGQYTHHGFGSRSIVLFLNKISQITGKTLFRAKVMPDNIPSQKCFEKIGSKLIGVCNEGFIRLPEEKAKYEAEHLNLIDDNIRELAARLDVEPKRLLTDVLEYHIFCPLT